MERGFFHLSRGYWQTIGEPSQEIIDTYPTGTVEVPLKPGPFYEWDTVGKTWNPSAPPPVSPSEVKAEAMRRILEIAPEWKQRNLTAQAAILSEKGRANWTPEESAAWDSGKALWDSIAAIRSTSDQIEVMSPIPLDFTDNSYWP